MSAKLAMRVLESDLAQGLLKQTAVVLALFGSDTGERIYPSIDRIAFLLGGSNRRVNRRTIEKQMATLREMGIIVPQGPLDGGRLPGGRGRSVLYRLSVDALPQRGPFKPRHAGRGSTAN